MNISEAVIKKVINSFLENDPKQPGIWKEFKGYRILSPSKISIRYRTGYGGVSIDDNLVIDITNEIRDEKLNTLLDGKI